MSYAKCLVGVLACCAAIVRADTPNFPDEMTKREIECGGSKFVLEIDWPKRRVGTIPHALSIYTGDKLMAKHENVSLDKVYAAKDNAFFLGVSNGGIPGTAFVIFDAAGKVLREEKHDVLPEAMYTSRSATFVREWFDGANPEVEFDVREDRLLAVFIRGSNKQRYSLLERDLGFREAPQER